LRTRKNWKAQALETDVKNLVAKLLEDPEVWRLKVSEQINAEHERLRNPAKEAEAWQRHINDLDRKRDRLIDMAADGITSKDELRAKLHELGNQATGARQDSTA
jgi:hypothetical protein